MKKIESLFLHAIAAFFGSWLAVVLHFVLFSLWLHRRWSIDVLTMWVSLEAIFIGIFILMSQNQEQAQRDARQKVEQDKEMEIIEMDEQIDDKALHEVRTLRREIQKLQKIIEKITAQPK